MGHPLGKPSLDFLLCTSVYLQLNYAALAETVAPLNILYDIYI